MNHDLKRWDLWWADVVYEDLPIKLWKEAGLTKPSTVRCSKKLCLTELDIDEKIGELHPVDIKEVRKILQEMYGQI